MKDNPPNEQIPVIITDMDDNLWHIYDEAGIAVEVDFESEAEATEWAIDNGYLIVETFNI